MKLIHQDILMYKQYYATILQLNKDTENVKKSPHTLYR